MQTCCYLITYVSLRLGFLQRVRASLGLLSKTFQKNAQKQQDNDDDMGDTGNSTSSSTLSIMIMEEHLNKY